MTSITFLDRIQSDTRIAMVSNNKFKKMLYHGDINPKFHDSIRCLVVVKEKEVKNGEIIDELEDGK